MDELMDKFDAFDELKDDLDNWNNLFGELVLG